MTYFCEKTFLFRPTSLCAERKTVHNTNLSLLPFNFKINCNGKLPQISQRLRKKSSSFKKSRPTFLIFLLLTNRKLLNDALNNYQIRIFQTFRSRDGLAIVKRCSRGRQTLSTAGQMWENKVLRGPNYYVNNIQYFNHISIHQCKKYNNISKSN